MDWITTSTILGELRQTPARNDAWHRLVERFRPAVIAFARSLGLAADAAEDVAQETLLAFVEGFNEKYDREKGRLSHWLFGIAYRQAARHRSKQAARPVGVAAEGFWNDLPDEDSARHTWDIEWEQAMLAECLRRVAAEVEPATFRAFELAMMEGRSAADAAAELGVPIKTVYNAKHRVLKRIRELRAQQEQLEEGPGAA